MNHLPLIVSEVDPEQVGLFKLLGQMMMESDQFGIYNWIYYVTIFVLLVFIYNKVFRTRKLPLLKNLILYVLLAIGAFMLLLFQVDVGLPIIYSLGVAVALMLIVRIRKLFEERAARKQKSD